MGTRGPVPARDDQRRRRNKPDTPTTKVKVEGQSKVKVPRIPPNLHYIAAAWYKSLNESGQARFYEPSDWEAARFVAYEMSRLITNPRPSSQWFAALWSAMNDLLTTEASRRRVRMEIERKDQDQPAENAGGNVSYLDQYRGL